MGSAFCVEILVEQIKDPLAKGRAGGAEKSLDFSNYNEGASWPLSRKKS